MKRVNEIVANAQILLRGELGNLANQDGLTRDRYIRFLRMQYHLTKGVQRHFLFMAGHPATAKKRALRDWLIGFAKEEEFHFEIAKNDLKNLESDPGQPLFDTQLWWLFFDNIIEQRPFVRLGATCVLENISDGSADVLDGMIGRSDFLNPRNLKFLTIHRHGPNLDHGNQVLDAVETAKLNASEMADVEYGAEIGTLFYMRFIKWIIAGEVDSTFFLEKNDAA